MKSLRPLLHALIPHLNILRERIVQISSFSSKINRWVCVLAAAWVLFLGFFGRSVHWVEADEPASAENDMYADVASQLRHGQLPHDRFHPLLYPLAVAGSAAVTGDVFAAGRIVSSLSAGVFVVMTFLIARRLFGQTVALFSFGAILLNVTVLTHGILVSSDMLFCMLAILLLYCMFRARASSAHRWTLAMGVAYALAFFTRYQAILLAPAVVVALVGISGRSLKRLLVSTTVFGLTVLVLLLPHFVLTYKAFGTPLHNDNWKNTVWAASGREFSVMQDITPEDFKNNVLRSPRWLKMVGRNLASLANRPFRYLFSCSVYHYGAAEKFVGITLSFCMGYGLLRWVRRPSKETTLAVAFWGFYILGVCATWDPAPRFLLPVLPVCLMLAFDGLVASLSLASKVLARFRRSRAIGAAASPGASVSGSFEAPWLATWTIVGMLLPSMAFSAAVSLRAFVGRHPYAEVAAARMIRNQYPPTVRVCGTSLFVHHFVPYAYIPLPFPFPSLQADQAYEKMLREFVRSKKIDLVLIGRLSMYDAPRHYLTAEHPPAFMVPVYHDADVAVYKVVPELTATTP